MSKWIEVGHALPEHRKRVLVWCGYVEIARFYVKSDILLSHDQEEQCSPHFRRSSGDCRTLWVGPSFSCFDDGYELRPPITHWMPLPDEPVPDEPEGP